MENKRGRETSVRRQQKKTAPARSGWLARYRRQSRETLELALDEVPGYAEWRQFDPGPQGRRGRTLRGAAGTDQAATCASISLPASCPAGATWRRAWPPATSNSPRPAAAPDDRVTLVFNPCLVGSFRARRLGAQPARPAGGRRQPPGGRPGLAALRRPRIQPQASDRGRAHHRPPPLRQPENQPGLLDRRRCPAHGQGDQRL